MRRLSSRCLRGFSRSRCELVKTTYKPAAFRVVFSDYDTHRYLAGAVFLGLLAYHEVPLAEQTEKDEFGLPFFTQREVAKHKSKDSRIWVTYKNGVYDITDFVGQHPGGERILLAAGAAIDPFWAMYNQHTTKQVLTILSGLRIGTLYPSEEIVKVDFEDPYSKEPPRVNLGIVRCEKPFNSETVIELIPDNYLTPIPMWYKRHHHPVPEVDQDAYRLVIAFEDANILQLSLDDIKKKFPFQKRTITLQCAGNRRHELEKVGAVQGLEWDSGAISTAEWGGVMLSDVLEYAGLGNTSALIEHANVRHIHFAGADQPFDSSVPVEKALSRFGDVMLAYEMNGQPLPREHGGPIRIICPGHLAARSTKWCNRITASKVEASSGWQRGFAYKAVPALKSFDGIDPESFPSVQELPVTSVICLPKPESNIDYEEGEITMKGWAWSGGGRNIIRVEVSADGGKTWQVADLGEGKEQPNNRAWAWTFWEAEVKLPPCKPGEKLELVCRAVDAAMNTQPSELEAVWNLRGIVNNAYHRIPVNAVEPDDD